MRVLDLLFEDLIRLGAIRVIDHTGQRRDYGDGGTPRATVRFTDKATEWRVFLAPHYHLLEAYTEGKLVVEEGSFHDFLEVCCVNLGETGLSFVHRLHHTLGQLFLVWEHYNPARLARKRISHHYDLHENLFRLFLDPDMQYSCAYFPTPDTTLATAQIAKKRHIAAKLLLKDGQRVLDIGCGWGGMALTIASLANVEVLGITLSVEQLEVARKRAEEAGLSHRVKFELIDYRHLTGQFDRIVSVGMFEHVGPRHYATYFSKIRDLLTYDGVALVHSIGDVDAGGCNPWIRRRIFPGAYTPALSQVMKGVEKSRLWATDVEILRLHYAETLKAWRETFLEKRAEAAALYDERFCRMWEAYLDSCELGFRELSLMVFQVQLTKHRHAVPLTRDYMLDQERDWNDIAEGNGVL